MSQSGTPQGSDGRTSPLTHPLRVLTPTAASSSPCFHLRPAQQPRQNITGAAGGERMRTLGTPPRLVSAPFLDGGGLALVHTRRGEERGGAVRAPKTGSRERPARDLLAPLPALCLPGSAAASASVGPRWLQRLNGLSPGAPWRPSAPARSTAHPCCPGAGLGHGRSPGIASAPSAPGPPPMGPG